MASYPYNNWHPELEDRLNADELQKIDHLIIVPGHALLKDEAERGENFEYYNYKDRWHLEGYQHGEFGCYIEHVRAGILALKNDPNAVLTFSGGRTRPGNKEWSEAGSYLAVAKALPQWGESISKRVLTEDYARDSIQNLGFSYLRYFMETGRLPKKISIFGLGFKEARFDWHRETLGIPRVDFDYVAVNDPPPEKMSRIKGLESEHLAVYKSDPFGLSEDLMQKKTQRDPHHDGHPYADLLMDLTFGTNRDLWRNLLG